MVDCVVVQVLEFPETGVHPVHAYDVGDCEQFAVSVRLALITGLAVDGVSAHVGACGIALHESVQLPPVWAGGVSVKSLQLGSLSVSVAACAPTATPPATPTPIAAAMNPRILDM